MNYCICHGRWTVTDAAGYCSLGYEEYLAEAAVRHDTQTRKEVALWEH